MINNSSRDTPHHPSAAHPTSSSPPPKGSPCAPRAPRQPRFHTEKTTLKFARNVTTTDDPKGPNPLAVSDTFGRKALRLKQVLDTTTLTATKPLDGLTDPHPPGSSYPPLGCPHPEVTTPQEPAEDTHPPGASYPSLDGHPPRVRQRRTAWPQPSGSETTTQVLAPCRHALRGFRMGYVVVALGSTRSVRAGAHRKGRPTVHDE
jgi:hypothetical protein